MWRLIALTAACLVLPAAGQAPDNRRVGVVARVLTQPPMPPEEVARAEAALLANPGDLATRLRLLTHYSESFPLPGHDDPVKRAARLRHIAYMVEQQPGLVDPVSPLYYVFRSGGHYADAGDHEMVRALWMRQAEANPLSAARFLFVENKREAEDLLRRAVERNPDDRRLAANLGFFYAMQVLGLDSLSGSVAARMTEAEREQDRLRARSELDTCTNAAVLAGAATAIPNLSMRASRGRPVDPELFQSASRLMAKARELAPTDQAFSGPMPMIEYFQEAQHAVRPQTALPQAALALQRVRIGFAVQKSKLVEAPQPEYPEQARAAGIEGDVRFDAVIGRDGAIAGLTTRSGHPMLVPAAIEAVKQWRFRPTLLNGNPVEVVTEIVVTFPPR